MRYLRHATVAVLLLSSFGCTTPRLTPRAPTPGKQQLKVLTYNVNYGLAGDPATTAAIVDAGADVIFLQETNERWERTLRAEMSSDWPHMEFRHCCGAGGLAVLSKYPFEHGNYVPSPGGWFPGWRVIVDSPLGKVQVLHVHLRPPVSDSGSIVSGYFTTDKYRDAEMRAFTPTLDPGLPTLVLGDFNEEDGDALERLQRRGLRDAVTAFHPGQHTWRWPTRFGDITFALDHVLHDAQLVPLNVQILEAGRSDHLPILVELERAS